MEQKLRTLMKYSMLAKRQDETIENVARSVTFKSILDNAQKVAKDKKIDIANGIPDSLIIDAAKKEVKQLNELLSFCTDDMSEKKVEIAFKISAAQELLPSMATEFQIMDYLVSSNIEKNMGVCMKSLKSHFGDALDGKVAQTVVKSYIK